MRFFIGLGEGWIGYEDCVLWRQYDFAGDIGISPRRNNVGCGNVSFLVVLPAPALAFGGNWSWHSHCPGKPVPTALDSLPIECGPFHLPWE